MFLPVMNACTPLKAPHFPFSGTLPFASVGQRVPASARALFFLLAGTLSLSACAGRRIPQSDQLPQEQRLWNSCEETIPANADGFQHFVCADVHSKRWEVLIRKEPK